MTIEKNTVLSLCFVMKNDRGEVLEEIVLGYPVVINEKICVEDCACYE